MMLVGSERLQVTSAVSADGTPIGYSSLGQGPGLIIVGGVLSSGADYLPLAHVLAEDFEVHVMDRRGRPNSGPQRQDHSIDDECADLIAVVRSTGATAVFGHSFGALVALETARRQPVFDQLFVYEPGVPLRGQFRFDWLDGYQERLESDDRRGAFAWMVKQNGFAPGPLAIMPLPYVRAVLRLAIRSRQWASMDPLLEANLVEHRIEAASTRPARRDSRPSPPGPFSWAGPRARPSSASNSSPSSPMSSPTPPWRSSPDLTISRHNTSQARSRPRSLEAASPSPPA